MMIFEKKYAPKTFGDLIFPDASTKQRVWEYANNERHDSLILHGPYGTAKTTTARIVDKTRATSDDYNNFSFYKGCDMTFDSFDHIHNDQTLLRLSTMEMPVTIIDEVDQIPPEIQYKLRWEVDMRGDQGCFIFTTNKLHNVEKGLVDRCDVIELPAVNTDHWFDRARWMLEQEGVRISDAKLKALLDTCDGSIRDLLRTLQDAALRHPRAI